jgi:hypothetical protein
LGEREEIEKKNLPQNCEKLRQKSSLTQDCEKKDKMNRGFYHKNG